MQIGKWKITVKDFVWFIICLVLILCIFVGLFICRKQSASAVLSGASTAVSIVLSIVAILYTMIEGANSSRVNQDSINKLASIELQLKQVTEKVTELKDLDKRIRYVVPQLDMAVQRIEQSSSAGDTEAIGEDIKLNMQYLRNYIKEDIDD